MNEKLSKSKIKTHLSKLDEWKLKKNSIRKTFTFKDFKGALEFTNGVGALAEEARHHPDIELSWGKVVVTLSTHDAGGVTEKDIILASQIEEL